MSKTIINWPSFNQLDNLVRNFPVTWGTERKLTAEQADQINQAIAEAKAQMEKAQAIIDSLKK